MIRFAFTLIVIVSLGVGFAVPQKDEFTPRLETLRPGSAAAYFELGEEIADAARTPEQRDLARRLFVLSFAIASEGELERWLMPSACLALASIEPSDERRAWLRALASLTDPRYASVVTTIGGDEEGRSASAEFALAEFVGLTRGGFGVMARNRIEDPAVKAVAERIRIEPSSRAKPIAISRLEAEASIWPCPECANARTIPSPDDRRSRVVFCPTCRGDPGPLLTPEEFIGAVVLEAILLNAGATTWSADLSLGLDRPIRDPSESELAEFYGIDTAARWFVDGVWTAEPPSEN